MKSPKLRFVLLLAVSLLLLAACGNAGGVGPDWDENILVYAVMNPHHVDQAAVNRFNETHTDVQIEVRNYYDEDDPFGEKGKERLTTEILAGRIPDILDIGDGSGSLPYRQLAERGYLEDLWPYIDSDPELGRESLMEAPLKAAEVNGGLYVAFRSVTINTLIGAERLVGDRMSWTLEDLREAFAAMPEGSTITDFYAGKDFMFEMICSVKLDGYVDWETGACFFDSEDFRSTLEFINSFPAKTEEIADSQTGAPDMEKLDELGWRRRNGLQMLSMTDITRIDDMQMNDLLFNGRTSYVGYPTSDGSVGSSFEPNAMHRLAISSVCRNKEAAWEFVREELLPRYNTESMKAHLSGMGSGFPINRADYELMRRMRIHNGSKFFGYTVVIGSEPVELPPLPEEDVLRLEALYNSIERIDLNDNAIYDIVWEQCTPYFTGDRSLDETVQLVQNRVKLYVSENR
ncbi:MAG: extracellular solute-binding protein [Oscillibacter sp.]|nr:extracellular solute-binding protein [Oscillibacter sp.]